jgi:hypothetical protein
MEAEAIEKLRQTESECERFEAELREIERQESEQDKEEEQLSFQHISPPFPSHHEISIEQYRRVPWWFKQVLG